MSALAQRFSYIPSPRRLSEVELLRSVSTVTWCATNAEEGLAAIAADVLRVTGLTGIRFEPHAAFVHLPIYESSHQQASASALSPVTANGRNWGQIRLFFDPHLKLNLESPVRLAKFIGQQLGILFDRLHLKHERVQLQANLDGIHRIIRRRKIIHRAAVVLAEQRNISEKQAVSEMVAYARRNHRNLVDLAESLIFGYDSVAFTRPSLRRTATTERS